MQAMILAAGFGTRLLPYTKLRPKPLFPLLNEPLLLLTIKRLQHAGFDHIIVNCHHLKEQIVTALHGLKGVVVQEEDIVLGTGGGLRMALATMRDEPVLVTNGDIYHSIDYLELYKSHEAGNAPVTMAMHDYPRFNNVCVKQGLVTGFGGQGNEDCLAFTGLHVLDTEVLKDIPETGKSCIIDRYRQLLMNGGNIQAKDVTGCSWTDMGTVADYLALHGQLLTGEIPLWREFATSYKGTDLCQQRTTKHIFDDWVCVGNAPLPKELHLTRCVVWDTAILENGSEYTDRLLV
jgi:mannose-1-phosphate guanylyltransferase